MMYDGTEDEPDTALELRYWDSKTRLPALRCRRAAPRGEDLTPDRVAEILTAQDAEWARSPSSDS